MNKVQVLGQKKTAKAKAECTESSSFLVLVNNCPLDMVEDELLRSKFYDVITIIGLKYLDNLKINVKVTGGGPIARMCAARQAFCRAVVAFYSKYLDEWNKQEIKNRLISFDKFALVTDPRRQEPKKFGGVGARARYQKSYR